MRTLVARRYAKALFELLPERADQDAAGAQLLEWSGHAAGTSSFRDLIRNPVFSARGREAAVAEIARRMGVSSSTKNLLLLLARKNRLNLLEEISASFQNLVDQTQGRASVRLTVPGALAQIDRDRILRRLESITQNRVSLEVVVDPLIIGGIIVEIGGAVYDASLQGKLNLLRSQLTEA